MSKETKQLNVGDVLYSSKYGQYTGQVTIERVTNTQAIATLGKIEVRFDRNYLSGYIRERGGNSYSRRQWDVSTPEIERQVELQEWQNKVSRLPKINVKNVPVEDLKSLYKHYMEVYEKSKEAK